MKKSLLIIFLFNIILSAQSGVIKSYYSNKNLRSEVSYAGDIYNGTSYWYYENGMLKSEKTYSDGKLNGWVRNYYESGLLQEEFYVVDGVRDGTYRLYHSNGGIESIRVYKNGKLIKKQDIAFDPYYTAPPEIYNAGNRQFVNSKKLRGSFCDVEVCPIPIGGMSAIQEKLVYPEHAKLYGLEGTVELIATVDKNGNVEKITIIKGIGLGCDEAAAEAVQKTKFIPGKEKGKEVKSGINLKVEFKLDDAKDSPVKIVKSTEKEKVEYVELEDNKEDDSIVEFVYETSDNFGNVECDLENCARPVNGVESILENAQFPVMEKSISGDVKMSVRVDKEGKVRFTEIVKGIDDKIDLALEVATLSIKFIPAMKNDKPVESVSVITIPISIKAGVN